LSLKNLDSQMMALEKFKTTHPSQIPVL